MTQLRPKLQQRNDVANLEAAPDIRSQPGFNGRALNPIAEATRRFGPDTPCCVPAKRLADRRLLTPAALRGSHAYLVDLT